MKRGTQLILKAEAIDSNSEITLAAALCDLKSARAAKGNLQEQRAWVAQATSRLIAILDHSDDGVYVSLPDRT